MNTKFVIVAAALGLAVAGPAAANADLAKKSGCLNCHNVEGAKKMGPSFKDIGAKYKGKADAEATLVEKLKSGKGHPAQKASEDDLKTLVKWITTM
jgi:cytochrome c